MDTESSLSLHNWVTDYGMACSPKYHFGLFGSLFFVAVVLSSLLFPPLADKYGRKIVCVAGIGVACITQTILLFSTSRQFTYVLIFILGLAMAPRIFVGYIYAMEFLPRDKTQQVTAVIMGNDGLVMVIATLWFMFISKHWKTLFLTATIISYLCFIIMCTMPESPKFLVGSGQYDEARSVMSRIAKYNGIQELKISSEDKNRNF